MAMEGLETEKHNQFNKLQMLLHSLSCGIIYGGAFGHFKVPIGYALLCGRRALVYYDAN
jgi:hypothetical protein